MRNYFKANGMWKKTICGICSRKDAQLGTSGAEYKHVNSHSSDVNETHVSLMSNRLDR